MSDEDGCSNLNDIELYRNRAIDFLGEIQSEKLILRIYNFVCRLITEEQNQGDPLM